MNLQDNIKHIARRIRTIETVLSGDTLGRREAEIWRNRLAGLKEELEILKEEEKEQ